MSHSALSTVPAADDGEHPYELERVAVPTPGEIRFLHRIGPARAHRRLAEHVEDYVAAMAADAATKRSAARDEEHLEQLQEDYADGIVSQHGRTLEAAWDEHRRCLERISGPELREVARVHNSAPSWMSMLMVQRAATVLKARGHPRGPRRTRPSGSNSRPRVRRTAARRALGPRAGQDPGDEGDPERPPSRGEPIARVLVRGKSGIFLADECRIECGVVTASGRWRWRWGPNYSRSRFGPPVARSWPARRCEIRWARDHGEVSR